MNERAGRAVREPAGRSGTAAVATVFVRARRVVLAIGIVGCSVSGHVAAELDPVATGARGTQGKATRVQVLR
ncbi:hypothetical protein MHA02_42370 [Methylobacterium haplocladii]|uniref:Uncharacterized protein n=1 Tax=Methylobacterium haplocladii TaxID=1176176 RepID=A0A512IVV7_9HYPH|nr:hypothetical protein MHA02_42370 [Methylobacterium haplocladii]